VRAHLLLKRDVNSFTRETGAVLPTSICTNAPLSFWSSGQANEVLARAIACFDPLVFVAVCGVVGYNEKCNIKWS
jgi:hypothetical protein